jgi:hypothetical protein
MVNNINYGELTQEIQRTHEQYPELAAAHPKEAITRVLQERTVAAQQQPASPAPATPVQAAPMQAGDDLPDYAKSADPQAKNIVEQLVHLTFEKGLDEGVAQASSLDPFLLDMYHDALAEKLIEDMKEKNLL